MYWQYMYSSIGSLTLKLKKCIKDISTKTNQNSTKYCNIKGQFGMLRLDAS